MKNAPATSSAIPLGNERGSDTVAKVVPNRKGS